MTLKEIVESEKAKGCTDNAETCPLPECGACSVRDCPDKDPFHYHHDGCPACDGGMS